MMDTGVEGRGIIPLYVAGDVALVKTEGCHVIDEDGRQYADFEAGVWAANLGHNHPAMAEAIRQSLEGAFHHGYRFRNPPSEALSANLNALCRFPGGQSAFLSSGSEAMNLGLQMARHLTGRRKILRLGESYLSAYGFGRIAEDNEARIDLQDDAPEALAGVNWAEVAAVALEVGHASIDLMRFPAKALVAELCTRAQQAGCLVVADEVTTGFGRTGLWFGYQHYAVVPDMVVTGKALGNGYPVSGVTVNGDITAALAARPLRYAQSHQNDPCGCAVGNAVIGYFLRHEIVEQAAQTGAYFLAQLQGLQAQHAERIMDVRGRGLMLALQLDTENAAESMTEDLFSAGFVVGQRGPNLRFMPPLVIGRELIDELIAQIDLLL